MNERLRERHALGRLAVLSMAEGIPTALLPLVPPLIVVPPESAFPGYGDFLTLPGALHILANVCHKFAGSHGHVFPETGGLLMCARPTGLSHGVRLIVPGCHAMHGLHIL